MYMKMKAPTNNTLFGGKYERPAAAPAPAARVDVGFGERKYRPNPSASTMQLP